MNNKILGIIIILFGGIVLFSKLEAAIWVSAISIGIGSGIFFFWKDEKNGPKSRYGSAFVLSGFLEACALEILEIA